MHACPPKLQISKLERKETKKVLYQMINDHHSAHILTTQVLEPCSSKILLNKTREADMMQNNLFQVLLNFLLRGRCPSSPQNLTDSLAEERCTLGVGDKAGGNRDIENSGVVLVVESEIQWSWCVCGSERVIFTGWGSLGQI
jgi:hypothetical protein